MNHLTQAGHKDMIGTCRLLHEAPGNEGHNRLFLYASFYSWAICSSSFKTLKSRLARPQLNLLQ